MNIKDVDRLIKSSHKIPNFYMLDLKRYDGRSVHEPKLFLSDDPLPDAQAVGSIMVEVLKEPGIKTVVSIIALDGAKDMRTIDNAARLGMGYLFDAGVNPRMIYADIDAFPAYMDEIYRGDYS